MVMGVCGGGSVNEVCMEVTGTLGVGCVVVGGWVSEFWQVA